ncbi:MAG: hypothetical protein DMF02_07520 [Verrucomicrobia bacterium]|nr:MAG: hypothetical protein DMF02_07520 [Verrucomicrobiota bacterium]
MEGDDFAGAAGGSASEGNMSGSIDSCACAARRVAKKIPATELRIRGRTAGRGIPRAVRFGNAAERYMVKAKPVRMAARLDWRHKPVN